MLFKTEEFEPSIEESLSGLELKERFHDTLFLLDSPLGFVPVQIGPQKMAVRGVLVGGKILPQER